MRYLRCPDCAELVDASLDVCPHCNALMRLPRGEDSAEELVDPESHAVPERE